MLCRVWIPRGENTAGGDGVQAVRIFTQGTHNTVSSLRSPYYPRVHHNRQTLFCASCWNNEPSFTSLPLLFQKRKRGGASRSSKITQKTEDVTAQILSTSKEIGDRQSVASEKESADNYGAVEAEEKANGAPTAPLGGEQHHHTESLLLKKKKKKKKKKLKTPT